MANNTDRHNEKLEQQNRQLKKKNKRGGKVILILLLIILVLAAAIFLFDPLGFGNGMGILINGGASGSGSGSAAPAQTTQQTYEAEVTAAPVTEPTVTNINVTISGATYMYNGAEATVDDIIAAATDAEGEVIVKIRNDSATANAMDELIAELDKNTLPYTIEE